MEKCIECPKAYNCLKRSLDGGCEGGKAFVPISEDYYPPAEDRVWPLPDRS